MSIPATLGGYSLIQAQKTLGPELHPGEHATSSSNDTSGPNYVLGGTGTTLDPVTPQLLLSNLPSNLQPSTTLFYYNPQAEDAALQTAALKQTGQATFVSGLSSDSQLQLSVTDQEKLVLYANAKQYAEAHDIQLGQALTQQQIGELTQPMLWYVEQTVPEPGCTATGTASCPTVTALMPQVYLPANTSALSADGNIVASDSLKLNFGSKESGGSILNTGAISSGGSLTVNTGTLTNQANQVNVGQIWEKVKGGYVDTTGTEVQPGGFMSATNMDLNVQTLNQIGGALQQLNADGTVSQAGTQKMLAALQQQLSDQFTQTTLSDHLHTDFVKEGGGLPPVVVAALAIAASIVTAGAAAAAAGVVMTQLSVGSVLIGALGGMVGSAVGQLASGQGLDFGQILEAGAIGALTAGAMSALHLADLASLHTVGSEIANGTVQMADVGKALVTIGERGLVTASVDTAVEGGSFGRAFETSVIGDLGAVGASAIGAKAGDANSLLAEKSVGNVLAHAAVGCVLSAAEGSGCAGGAIGGATSALVAPLVRDALYGGSQKVNYVEGADGSVTKVTSYDNPLYNSATAAISTLTAGAFGSAAGVNSSGAMTAAENEVFNNSLSPKYSNVTAQVNACSGQGRACYVQALAVTQQAYDQAKQEVASACGAGGDAAACNTAKSDAAQLYVNQKTLAQSVATMTDYNTPLSNAVHTIAFDGLSLAGGAILGKVISTVRSGWSALSSPTANAFESAIESTTVGDKPYSGPNGTSDDEMAHPVASNSAVATTAGATGSGRVPPQLLSGQAAESAQLASLNSLGKVTFTPTPEQVNSSTFKLIVGEPQYTPSGDLVSTIYDGSPPGELAELKNGTSPLSSSYQLRLQTYGSLISDTPFTIYTSRPVNPTFSQWLTRWGVNVKPLPQ